MEIKLDVVRRLEGFGYKVTEEDTSFVDYIVASVGQEICNLTNLDEVPEGLRYEWIDAVCGELLRIKLSTGKLDNVAQIVKSIAEGDTTVTYSDKMTPEAQLLVCIEKLGLDMGQLVRYRVLTW